MLRGSDDRSVTRAKQGEFRNAWAHAARSGGLSYDRHVLPRHALNHIRLLRYAGLFTYACVGVPLVSYNWMLARLVESRPREQLNQLQQVRSHTDVLLWAVSYVIFGVVYWLLTRDLRSQRRVPLKLLGLLVLTCAAIAICWFSKTGLAALLLMVVCMVLPWLLPLPLAAAWLVLQNAALIPVFALFPGWDAGLATLQAATYLGFSVIAFVASMVARQEGSAREEQRRLNSELRATRALLAESSRISERMRIARELHDLVGHHLTALSLNLEVASHLANQPAAEHVEKAQSTAKQLLTDVREVVSELRDDDAIDLTDALRNITEGVPGLDVHLDLPPRFSVDDPHRAQVLLRCAQEIVTNAVRHAGAKNLWLRFERTPDGMLALKAHDDGRGAAEVRPGNGLSGMRERLAEVGGRLVIDTARDHGFTLEASMPIENAA
jgi:signal transduction histidine kinase